jgi:hypothetical protein
MRAILAVAAALLAVGSVVEAQEGPSFFYRKATAPEQIAAMTVDSAFNGITLTTDQRTKALNILTRTDASASAFDRQAPDLDRQMCALRRRRNADFKALLSTDPDRAKFDENVKNPIESISGNPLPRRICAPGN